MRPLSTWIFTLSLLLASFFSLLVVDPFKYAAASHLKAGGGLAALPGLFAHSLSWLTWPLLLSVLAGGLHLVWREARHGEMGQALATPGHGILFAALLLWLGHTYLTPGWLVVGDANAHLARVLHLTRAWAEQVPSWWSNHFYTGTPVLQFTGPLFFWLAALLATWLGEADLAVKVLLLICHFFSAWAIFGLARAWGMTRFGAAVSSLVYAGSFAHLHPLLHGGMFPQALIYAALPALFLFLWQLLDADTPLFPTWGAFCLVAAALLFTHQTSAAAVALFAGLFTLTRMAGGHFPWPRLGWLAAAGGSAILMAGVVIIPLFLESSWVVMEKLPTTFHLTWPGLPRLTALVTWRDALSGIDSEAYLGLVPVGLALVGLWATPATRGLVATLAGLLLLALCMRISYVRNILFILFFVSLLAGFGAQRLTTREAGKRLVLLLLLLDLTSTAIQPWARTDKGHFDTAARRLMADFPNQRVLLLSDREIADSEKTASERLTRLGQYRGIEVEIGPNGGILGRYPIEKLDGPHNLTVPKTHNYLVALSKRVEREIQARGELSPDTRHLLCLLNVGLLARVHEDGRGLTGQVEGSIPHADLGGILPLTCHTPVVAAPRLTPLPPPPGLDSPPAWRVHPVRPHMEQLLDQMTQFFVTLETGTEVVPTLPVRVTATTAPSSPPLDRLNLLDYQVTSHRVQLSVDTNGAGFAHLAHPWYPALTVQRNGENITPLQSPMGFMVVPVVPGRNDLVIEPTLTPVRWLWSRISGGIFLVVLVSTLWAFLRKT